jgi:adenylate cyclase
MTATDRGDRVRRWLRDRGVSDEDIDRASRDGQLHVLVADRLAVPDPPQYTAAELEELTGLPAEQNQRLWRALGFAVPDSDEPVFTEADLAALTSVVGLMYLGIADEAEMVQLTRVIGSSMARIAEAEVESSPVLRGGLDSETMAELYILAGDAIFPDIARLLEYAWRRHLQAALRRGALRRERTNDAGMVDMAIGFADLVGFTSLSQQLSERALAEVVGRFEELAYETVHKLGGRVVKMIGDEVMFLCADAAQAASVALELSSVYEADDMLSDVRVGLAAGPVLLRDGDCFGPAVNLANRIVNIAAPGSVLVEPEVRHRLDGDPRFAWKSLRPRYLKDIGRVHLWVMFRKGDESRKRRNRGLGVVRDSVREQVERAHTIGRDVIDDLR